MSTPTLSGITPDQLALRARAGDNQALGQLLAQYRPLILAEATRFSGTPGQSPEDLEAIARLCLWRLVTKYDPARGSWGSLAKQGLTHCLTNCLRDATRPHRWSGQAPTSLEGLQGGEEGWEPAAGVDVEAVALGRLHADQVTKWALRLTADPVEKRLLEGVMFEVPLATTARETGVPSSTLCHRRAVLLQRLRQQLQWLAP